VLEPAPASGAWRWNSAQYLGSYGMQAAQLLQSHAQTAEPFPVPVAGAVSVYERVPVYVVSGWRDAGH
jgi:hypothetical protein